MSQRWCLAAVVVLCLIGISFLFVIMPAPAFAEPANGSGEESDTSVPVLDPLVVSATKTPVPISQVTSAVEVITSEELQRRKVKTVVDALRLSQNLAVFSNGGPGTTVTVRIRGGTSSQTLVLIDGAIVNSATLGSFDFSTLTTDNIERIEILRGAQSMLWGADAIGGVINIVTKRGTGAPRASVFVEYGSFVSLREGGSVSGKKGPVDFSLSLSRWDIANISAVNYRRGAIERDAFRNWQASAQLGVDLPRDGRFDFFFRWLNGDTNFDNGSTFGGGPFDIFKAKSTSNRYVFSGSYEQPLTSWWSQKLTLSRAQEDSINQAGTLQRSVTTGAVSAAPSFNNSRIETLSNRIEWQHNFHTGEFGLLTLGYQFREQQGENISSSAIPLSIISNHSGFAQFQVDLWDRLFATAGVRQDAFNTFGDATTYRVTGAYLHKETGTKVRSSYATGFRAPTINDLLFPNFGNPNVKPEKSQSFDIAVEQFLFDKRVTISAGYFWNRFRDLIVAVQSAAVCGTGAFGANFCAQNVGAAVAKGWEIAFKSVLVADHPWMKALDLQAQYTKTMTRDLAQNPGSRLARWPVEQASAILSYQPIDPLRINLTFRYVGNRFNSTGNRNPLPSFDVWGLSATYDATERVQFYVKVENLFDEKYEEILLFGTPGRSIWGGVTMNFDLLSGAER